MGQGLRFLSEEVTQASPCFILVAFLSEILDWSQSVGSHPTLSFFLVRRKVQRRNHPDLGRHLCRDGGFDLSDHRRNVVLSDDQRGLIYLPDPVWDVFIRSPGWKHLYWPCQHGGFDHDYRRSSSPSAISPTSPVNGDIWTTASGLSYYINGANRIPCDLGRRNVYRQDHDGRLEHDERRLPSSARRGTDESDCWRCLDDSRRIVRKHRRTRNPAVRHAWSDDELHGNFHSLWCQYQPWKLHGCHDHRPWKWCHGYGHDQGYQHRHRRRLWLDDEHRHRQFSIRRDIHDHAQRNRHGDRPGQRRRGVGQLQRKRCGGHPCVVERFEHHRPWCCELPRELHDGHQRRKLCRALYPRRHRLRHYHALHFIDDSIPGSRRP